LYLGGYALYSKDCSRLKSNKPGSGIAENPIQKYHFDLPFCINNLE
jgi:hypothetical protein